ncbi:MAG TPA: hypothetical protein PLC65_01260 [Bacteroidia bacterium]|nr:hypothetical protein [Bacteroidia bacterium]
MASVKQIQCPACGANSTYKTVHGNYMCNYCQSTFEVTSATQKTNPVQQAFPHSTPLSPKAGKVLGIAIVGFFVVLFGIGISVFLITKTNVNATSVQDVFSEWQKPYIYHYECFVGSKGPVAWLVMQQTRNRLDSVKYKINIIDPSSEKVLAEKDYLPQMTWKESFNVSKKIDNEFVLINDLAYNSSEENLICAFDIYTFEKKEDAETIKKKFPELSSGISKTELIRYKNAFKLTTNDGDEFVYYPARNVLRKQKEDDMSYRTDTSTVHQIYLREKENHKQLWLVKQIIDASRNEMDVYGYGLEEIANGKNSRGPIKSAMQISDKKFFKAQGLTRFKNNYILVYAENLSKKARVILESYSSEGKSNWQLIHPDLQILIESPLQTLNCDYSTNGKTLVININGANRKSVCFDLESGKHLWTFSPKEN